MADKTSIGWTTATFNPWWGCVEVSPACDHCYARTQSSMGDKQRGFTIWGKDAPRRFYGDKYWHEPVRWNRGAERRGKRRTVFCMSMGDVLEDRDDLTPHRERLWALILDTPWLDWQLLTKRPQNYRRMVPLDVLALPNVWPGTTVESAEQGWRATVLSDLVCAGPRFVSYEPILGPLVPANWPKIAWWILGGESGPGWRAMPIEWLTDAVASAQSIGQRVFVKQDSGARTGRQGRIPDAVWTCKQFPQGCASDREAVEAST